MSREITRRFAAIGDDLSPPKEKPAPVPKPVKAEASVVAGRNTVHLTLLWMELEVLTFAGINNPTPDELMIVREAMRRYQTIDKAGRAVIALLSKNNGRDALVDDKVEQKRREDDVRRMVLKEFGPGLPVDVIDGIVQAEIEYDKATKTMDAKQAKWWGERLSYIRYQAQKSARQTMPPATWLTSPPYFTEGVRVTQDYDYATETMLVRKTYPDGRVVDEKFDRRAIEEGMMPGYFKVVDPQW